MRLIDADALLEAMKDSAEVNVGFISTLATHVSLSDVLDLITNAPTVQREVPESIKDLIKNQQQLPADMQKILYDNLDNLYESVAPSDKE